MCVSSVDVLAISSSERLVEKVCEKVCEDVRLGGVNGSPMLGVKDLSSFCSGHT
jgi:hypothetical protein